MGSVRSPPQISSPECLRSPACTTLHVTYLSNWLADFVYNDFLQNSHAIEEHMRILGKGSFECFIDLKQFQHRLGEIYGKPRL